VVAVLCVRPDGFGQQVTVKLDTAATRVEFTLSDGNPKQGRRATGAR
jgi:hypothetical protein